MARLRKKGEETRSDEVAIRDARVVRRPGAGSCLFHTTAYGLGSTGGPALRREISEIIRRNPNFAGADMPIKNWVSFDEGGSVDAHLVTCRGLRRRLYASCIKVDLRRESTPSPYLKSYMRMVLLSPHWVIKTSEELRLATRITEEIAAEVAGEIAEKVYFPPTQAHARKPPFFPR